MSFGDAVSAGLSRYFDFEGRANRPEFWWFVLFLMLVGLGAGVVDLALGYGLEDVGPVSLIASLGMIVPGLAVGARRLHDIGRSGWWQLINIVPLIGLIILVYWWCQPTAST